MATEKLSSFIKDNNLGPDLSTLYDGDDITKQIELTQTLFKAKSQPNNWGNFFLSFINPRKPNCILYIILIIVINSNVYYMLKCGESKNQNSRTQSNFSTKNSTNIFWIITNAYFVTYSFNNKMIYEFLNYFPKTRCENKTYRLVDNLIFILGPFILLIFGLYSFLIFVVGMPAYLFSNLMQMSITIPSDIVKMAVFFIVCMSTGFFIVPILICGVIMMVKTILSMGIMPVFRSNNFSIPTIIKNNVFCIQAIVGGAIVIAGFMNLNNTISKSMSYVYFAILLYIIVVPFVKRNFMLTKNLHAYREL